MRLELTKAYRERVWNVGGGFLGRDRPIKSTGFEFASIEPFHTNRARKCRRTLQNIVRINVVTVQLTLFVNLFVAFKNVLFNSFLLNRPGNWSETQASLYFSNGKHRYKL